LRKEDALCVERKKVHIGPTIKVFGNEEVEGTIF
jgi:hypothetical protein